MKKKKKLKLAANIDCPGWNFFVGWQYPDIPADSSDNIDFYTQQAQLAESAKFDTLFLVDVRHVGPGNISHYLNMFEGVSIMSALSMHTKHIGLSATVSTSYADPFSVARQILSLDKISKGRVSLNAIFGLAVELAVNISEVSIEEAQRLTERAQQVCPYSNATRNNIGVKLTTTHN